MQFFGVGSKARQEPRPPERAARYPPQSLIVARHRGKRNTARSAVKEPPLPRGIPHLQGQTRKRHLAVEQQRMKTADIVVVGGGVIGCFAAYELAKAGASVVVVERGRVGAEATGASAGMLTPLNAAEEGEPTPLFDFYWASLQMFPPIVAELEETTGIRLEFAVSGALRLSQSEEEEQLRREQFEAWRQNLPAKISWLDAQEAHALEPALGPAVRGGVLSHEEATINPTRLVHALARAATRWGAQVMEDCMVTGVRHIHQRLTAVTTTAGDIATPHVVIAAGAWSRFCGEWLGVSLPITPVRGQMFSVRHLACPLTRAVFSYNGGLFPKMDGTVQVGATVEMVGFDKSVTPEGIASLMGLIPALVPCLQQGHIEQMWAGLRPWCEDGAPIIGALPEWQGVTVAAGHFRQGLLASPATAKAVKSIIVDGRSDPMVETFSPARFAHG
ncbi:MAG: glycine oxidase ThiO [Abditibacteriales bacterium]|nr:glycine oxidase ThiO [Abditibacteriales bacterium]MDW8366057.1 glycine oxidase ThiO [Abditibacteriales bacterium]